MDCKNPIELVSAAILVLSFTFAYAENIDPYEDDSQYAYSENAGWLNFEPDVAVPNAGATASSSKLTGFIWAENIGWINLSPASYGGVFNDGAGNLSGYAWGENVGWINFSPSYGGVTIDTNGDFNGWAWGENIGWLNFNSVDLDGYNVKVCKVSFEDMANFVDDWLESDTGLPADLDGSNDVDFADYAIFADCWLDYCPDNWLL
ncbi:MAG: hypothetical protein WC454_05395 [Phycisphaerae bacterium]|jgi:hypothetical protein